MNRKGRENPDCFVQFVQPSLASRGATPAISRIRLAVSGSNQSR